jgi:hypothetical protein
VHVGDRAKIDSEIIGMNYRLGNDEDRQKSNYLKKDEEGHVNNKKTRLTFLEKTL